MAVFYRPAWHCTPPSNGSCHTWNHSGLSEVKPHSLIPQAFHCSLACFSTWAGSPVSSFRLLSSALHPDFWAIRVQLVSDSAVLLAVDLQEQFHCSCSHPVCAASNSIQLLRCRGCHPMHVALLLIRSLLKSESPLSLSPVLLLKHSIHYWEVPLLLLEERSCWRPRNQKQVSISKLGRRVWDCKTQLWGGIYSLIPKLPPCIKWNYWMKKKTDWQLW